jgi:hypothetical protein
MVPDPRLLEAPPRSTRSSRCRSALDVLRHRHPPRHPHRAPQRLLAEPVPPNGACSATPQPVLPQIGRTCSTFRFHCDHPPMRKGEARAAAEILRAILRALPFPSGVEAYLRGHADALDPPKTEKLVKQSHGRHRQDCPAQRGTARGPLARPVLSQPEASLRRDSASSAAEGAQRPEPPPRSEGRPHERPSPVDV